MGKGKHEATRAWRAERTKLAAFKTDSPAFWKQNDRVAAAEKKVGFLARLFPN